MAGAAELGLLEFGELGQGFGGLEGDVAVFGGEGFEEVLAFAGEGEAHVLGHPGFEGLPGSGVEVDADGAGERVRVAYGGVGVVAFFVLGHGEEAGLRAEFVLPVPAGIGRPVADDADAEGVLGDGGHDVSGGVNPLHAGRPLAAAHAVAVDEEEGGVALGGKVDVNLAVGPLALVAELRPGGDVAPGRAGSEDARGEGGGDLGQRILRVNPDGGRDFAGRKDVGVGRLIVTDEEALWLVAVERLEAVEVLPDAVATHRSEGGDVAGEGGNGRLGAERVEMDVDVGMRFGEEVVESFEVGADEVVGEDVDGVVGEEIGRVRGGAGNGVGDVVGEGWFIVLGEGGEGGDGGG